MVGNFGPWDLWSLNSSQDFAPIQKSYNSIHRTWFLLLTWKIFPSFILYFPYGRMDCCCPISSFLRKIAWLSLSEDFTAFSGFTWTIFEICKNLGLGFAFWWCKHRLLDFFFRETQFYLVKNFGRKFWTVPFSKEIFFWQPLVYNSMKGSKQLPDSKIHHWYGLLFWRVLEFSRSFEV